MPGRSNNLTPAFTLVELVLVMALLVVFLALSAPSIAHSLNQHALKEEATRLLALTEYARSEAVSQGVPMEVWIDAQSQSFGARAKSGFGDAVHPGASTDQTASPSREKEYTLGEGMRFELGDAKTSRDGEAILTEMGPDGMPDESSMGFIEILDRNDVALDLTLSEDGWGYEIGEEASQ